MKCKGCNKELVSDKNYNVKDVVVVDYYGEAQIYDDGSCGGGSVNKSIYFHRKCFEKNKLDFKKYNVQEAINILNKVIK